MLFRLALKILPYAMVIGGLLLALVVGSKWLFDEHPEAATLTPVADIEAGTHPSKWVDLKDGNLVWINSVSWQTIDKKTNAVESETHYVPYLSNARLSASNGPLVLVELDDKKHMDLVPQSEADIAKFVAKYELSGVVSKGGLPKEVRESFEGDGYGPLYVIEPGSEPMSAGAELAIVGLGILIMLGGGFWSAKRIAAGEPFGS